MAQLEDIKKLRAQTQVGISTAREALDASHGDFEKAIQYLKKMGLDKQAKKSDREMSQGYIGSYVHGNGKIGVIVEVVCETDFVSNTEEFKTFCKDIALQIAGMNPKFVSREDISDENRKLLEEKAMEEIDVKGKSEQIIESIKLGKLQKVYEELVLLDQVYLKDETKKVSELLSESVLKFGENIKIRKFSRFQLE